MQLSFIFLLVVYTSMCAGLFCHERSDLRASANDPISERPRTIRSQSSASARRRREEPKRCRDRAAPRPRELVEQEPDAAAAHPHRKIDGARHLRPGPLEPRMATVLLVPPISSALRTRFSKEENKQLMDSGAPKVCCFILFVTGNVRMRMRRHELLAARRVFLQENLIFLGMKTPARCFWEPSNACNLRRKMMIDFIDIENTSLPPFCVIFGRKVEVVEEAGQSLPPAAQTREGGAGGQNRRG